MAHLIKDAGGHLAKAASGHLANVCPAATCYAIDSYYDGMLAACSTCYTDTAATVWNGGSICATGTPNQWEGPPADARINNKEMLTNEADITWVDPVRNFWSLTVSCHGHYPTGGSKLIWGGLKTIGADPTGTYTRTAGCAATPSTLDIVEE
jgi:hypothetical protein